MIKIEMKLFAQYSMIMNKWTLWSCESEYSIFHGQLTMLECTWEYARNEKNPSLSNLFSSNTNISYSLRCMCRQIKYFRLRQTHIDKQIESLDLEWHHSVGYILMYQQITYIDDFHIHKKKTRQDKTRDTKHPKNTIKKSHWNTRLGTNMHTATGPLFALSHVIVIMIHIK